MAKIDVLEANGNLFHVTVSANRMTDHDVTVQSEYSLQLCKGSTLELVKNPLNSCLKWN